MREPRLYVECELQVDSEISLPPQSAHYLASVLRRKAGQHVQLFNGEGFDYRASIIAMGKREVTLLVHSRSEQEAEAAFKITLVQGISRAQHMDYTLQKAVELGVGRIVPVLTEFSNIQLKDSRGEKKMEHWRKIVISACEQSGRSRLPELLPPQPLADWLGTNEGQLGLILHPGSSENGLSTIRLESGAVNLLVGPEGGFSDEEFELAGASGYQAISMGPRVLRTETAAVAAISICQSRWGDMG